MSMRRLLVTQLAIEIICVLVYSSVLTIIAWAERSHVRKQKRAHMRMRCAETQPSPTFLLRIAANFCECGAPLQEEGAWVAAVFGQKVILCIATIRINGQNLGCEDVEKSSTAEIAVLSFGECGDLCVLCVTPPAPILRKVAKYCKYCRETVRLGVKLGLKGTPLRHARTHSMLVSLALVDDIVSCYRHTCPPAYSAARLCTRFDCAAFVFTNLLHRICV